MCVAERLRTERPCEHQQAGHKAMLSGVGRRPDHRSAQRRVTDAVREAARQEMMAQSANHFQFHRTQGWCDDGACLAQGAAVKPALLASSTSPCLYRYTAAFSLPVTITSSAGNCRKRLMDIVRSAITTRGGVQEWSQPRCAPCWRSLSKRWHAALLGLICHPRRAIPPSIGWYPRLPEPCLGAGTDHPRDRRGGPAPRGGEPATPRRSE